LAVSKFFSYASLLGVANPNSLDIIRGMEMLSTTIEVMDALGGNLAVAEITRSKPKAVWNWRKSGVFPSNTYVAITGALLAKGKTAPPSLWGMKATGEGRAA
jgi:hypothetical protein